MTQLFIPLTQEVNFYAKKSLKLRVQCVADAIVVDIYVVRNGTEVLIENLNRTIRGYPQN